MKKILLTGASGFIGSSLYLLLSNIYKLILPMQTISESNQDHFLDHVEIVNGPFFAGHLISEYERFCPDIVIHSAAIRGVGRGKSEDYYRVNVLGTERLLDFALLNNVKLFIYFSTVGVYGTIPKIKPTNIHVELIPDNIYHISKYQAEQLVINKLKEKIPYVIMRPTITYGPGDNGFITKLIHFVRNKKFPLIRKNIKIHLLNVQTICEFISLLVQEKFSDQMIINLADHELIQFHELVDMIYSHFHGRNCPHYLKVPKWTFSTGKIVCDAIKIKKLKTALQLISESWYYDVSPLWDRYPLKKYDTLLSIGKLLHHEYPPK